MTQRTRMILTGLIAALAALATDRADAGFIRVRPLLFDGADEAFGGFEGLSGETGMTGLASPDRQDVPSTPPERVRLALEHLQGLLPSDAGGCGTPPSFQTTGGASTTAAIASSIDEIPQPTLTGWLPTEMGPSFCNPPPWTPLRPPRFER